MHIHFLKQNKKEILNWVEVTAGAMQNLSATIQSPIRGCMEWACIQGETQQKGPLFVSKENVFNSTLPTLERP